MADSWDRGGRAREALQILIRDYGPQVLSNPQLLRNLLGDKLPGSPREAGLLVSAAETGIPTSLRRNLDQGIPADIAVRQAVAALQERHAYDAAACSWVASELARALGHPVEEATVIPPVPAPAPAPAPAPGPAPVPIEAGHNAGGWLREHWWLAATAAVVVIVVLLAALVLRGGGKSDNAGTESSSSTTAMSTPTTSTSPATPAPDLSAYVGEWHVHGVSVIINSDGTGSAVWRVYKWCSDDPTPPCDQQNGNEIVNGGHAVFRLTGTTGSTATGIVSQTTDPQSVPNGQLLVQLLPGDHMSFANFQGQLCGPRSDPNTCGA